MSKNLPTLAELTAEPMEAYRKDQFNLLINRNPPTKWIKTHPYIKGHKYLPIDKIELLLKRIFKDYRIEILEEKMMMNAVMVRVRVHFFHPITNEWSYQDGVGAEELQTIKDSGSLKADMSNVQRGAVPMALPIAEVTAIKDACHKIGDIFGANLNRSDVQAYVADENLSGVADKRPELDDEGIERVKVNIASGDMTLERAGEIWKLSEEQIEYLTENK